MYATNITAPKIYEETINRIEGRGNCSIIITGDFNSLLSIMYRTTTQDINK
jgi:hypothetical protein